MAKEGQKLGKGLGALLPKMKKKAEPATPASDNTQSNGLSDSKTVIGRPIDIPITSIKANTHQPRDRFDQTKLDELAASIKEQGVLQPVVVRKIEGEGYELVAGERRTRASQLAGKETVPAVIADITDAHMLEAALVENVQREDLNAIEVALAYQAMIDDLELTHEQVAKRMGVSRVSVTNTLRLLGLSEELKEMVSRGTLGAGHARALLSIESTKEQMAIAKQVAVEDLSVREVERRVKSAVKKAKAPTKAKAEPSKDSHAVLGDYEDQLRNRFGTKVKIQDKGGKGQITIDYYSHDDFSRIASILGISGD